MKKLATVLCLKTISSLAILLLLATACSHSKTLWIFTASSLQDAYTELGMSFEQEFREKFGEQNPSIQIKFQFAGSSSLVRQINEGAPAQILVTANNVVLAELKNPNSPRAFAKTELVIAVPLDNPKNITRLRDLENNDLLIGQCLPEVPCGTLTQNIFNHLISTNQLSKINPDTYEPSARSTLNKLLLGELDAALIYEVDVIAANQIQERLLAIPINEVTPEMRQNNYFITLISDNPIDPTDLKNPANLFQDFLFTPKAQAILNRYGFILPNDILPN